MRKLSAPTFSDYRTLNQLLLHGRRLRGRPLTPGALVRGLRVRLKMSQRALARRAGVPQAHVSRIETGVIDPAVGTMATLLGAMFCDLALVPCQRVRLGEALYAQAGGLEDPWRRRHRMEHPSPRVWNE